MTVMTCIIECLEQPRERLEKAIQRVHEETLQINQNEIIKKCPSNPQEGKEKVDRKQNKSK